MPSALDDFFCRSTFEYAATALKNGPTRGNQEHGQFSKDTYRLEVINKIQVSDPGSLGPIFCDMILQNVINALFEFLLYVRHFLNMTMLGYICNSIHTFSKIYLNILISGFE